MKREKWIEIEGMNGKEKKVKKKRKKGRKALPPPLVHRAAGSETFPETLRSLALAPPRGHWGNSSSRNTDGYPLLGAGLQVGRYDPQMDATTLPQPLRSPRRGDVGLFWWEKLTNRQPAPTIR